ncbi:MAG: hypothetical protein AAFN93_15425 [Bacteroidota bacterium]
MKYYLLLFFSILFFMAGISMTYFLWNIEEGWEWKVFLLFISMFLLYLVIKNLQIYSKVKQKKNIIQVSKIFVKKTYNLNELTSWHERRNSYRANYRELRILFPHGKLTLIDHVDPDSIADLYHYLRTHYKDRMTQRW